MSETAETPEVEETTEAEAAPSGSTKIRGPWSLLRVRECTTKPKSVMLNGNKLAAKEWSHAKGVLTLTPAETPSGLVTVVLD